MPSSRTPVGGCFDMWRVWVTTNPPCVVFVVSVCIMMFGFLIIAFSLQFQDIEELVSIAEIDYCLPPSHNISTSSSAPQPDQTARHPPHSISIPVIVRAGDVGFAHHLLLKKDDSVLLHGRIFSGHFGLKASFHSVSFPFDLPLDRSSLECVGEVGDSSIEDSTGDNSTRPTAVPRTTISSGGCVWRTCLILYGDSALAEHLKPVSTSSMCPQNLSPSNSTTQTNGLVHVFIEQHDGTVPAQKRPTSRSKLWCGDGHVLTITHDSDASIVVPFLHDTLAARMHLLYTSYFLALLMLTAFCSVTLKHRCRRKRLASAADPIDFDSLVVH